MHCNGNIYEKYCCLENINERVSWTEFKFVLPFILVLHNSSVGWRCTGMTTTAFETLFKNNKQYFTPIETQLNVCQWNVLIEKFSTRISFMQSKPNQVLWCSMDMVLIANTKTWIHFVIMHTNMKQFKGDCLVLRWNASEKQMSNSSVFSMNQREKGNEKISEESGNEIGGGVKQEAK